MRPAMLVIGYGNELRGDDGVGPRVARAAAGWGRPEVRALAVHQLTPELAEALSDADQVIFVDAGAAGEGTPGMRSLDPATAEPGCGHTSDPRWLLALALAVYGRVPRAWLLTVPAASLEFGLGLSATAERGRAAALRLIRFMADAACLRTGGVRRA